MNYLKKILPLLGVVLLVITTNQCASAKKTQIKAPFKLGQVYYEWTLDDKGGGAEKSLYVPIISKDNSIILDSVYFQGEVTKLERINNSLFIGKFKTTATEKPDIIMSSNPHEEYGNSFQKPLQRNDIPFDLNNTQCVISYKEGNKISYFTIGGVIKK